MWTADREQKQIIVSAKRHGSKPFAAEGRAPPKALRCPAIRSCVSRPAQQRKRPTILLNTEISQSEPAARPKLLVMEFWGLGDLTFSTPLLQRAAPLWDVTLVSKEHARPLLGPSFPGLRFVALRCPLVGLSRQIQALEMGLARALRFDRAPAPRAIRRRRFRASTIRAITCSCGLSAPARRYGFPLEGQQRFPHRSAPSLEAETA